MPQGYVRMCTRMCVIVNLFQLMLVTVEGLAFYYHGSEDWLVVEQQNVTKR